MLRHYRDGRGVDVHSWSFKNGGNMGVENSVRENCKGVSYILITSEQIEEQHVAFKKKIAELLKNVEYKYNPQMLAINEHDNLSRDWGGQIVSVHSDFENRYILSLAKSGCWLGGMRLSTSEAPANKNHGPGSDHWEWSDGAAWEY